MTTPFDGLKRVSFDGIAFPVYGYTLRCGARFSLHEYPHTQGAAIEKLGRKLYEVNMRAIFDAKLLGEEAEELPLWPDRLALLMRILESTKTAELHIPTVGTIKAFCHDWSKEMSAGIRSGETADLSFIEDQSDAFLILGIVDVLTQSAPVLAGPLDTALKASAPVDPAQPRGIIPKGAMPLKPAEKTLLTSIVASANDLGAVVASGELYTTTVAAKAQALLAKCQKADATIRALLSPDHWQVVETIHQLGDAANQIYKNAAQKGGALKIYTVPRTMSVTDVSMAVYGDSAHGTDIIRLNSIQDVFSIQGGTRLRVYTDQAA